MKVVAVFLQVFAEGVIVIPAKALEKFSASLGNIDAPLRLAIPQSLAGRTMIGAKIGVCFHRRAVGVERENVRRHGSGIFVTRIIPNAVQNGFQIITLKQPIVFEKLVDGQSPGMARRRDCC